MSQNVICSECNDTHFIAVYNVYKLDEKGLPISELHPCDRCAPPQTYSIN